MNTTALVLGLIAGSTILLGMPVARLRRPAAGLRAFLMAGAAGVLVFLIWDILSAAWEPIDVLLADGGDALALSGYALLFLAGLTVGLLALPLIGRTGSRDGDSPRRLAAMIAIGIGLHNFAEGLAVGQSAAAGEIALATVLVIGFALHNATEGFGIVAPLADAPERPRWSFLLLLALIGGGPTFIGALLGSVVVSEPLSVLFLSLAAGSIVSVVIQLAVVASRDRRPALVAAGVLVGIVAGFATDGILIAGGA